MAQIYQYRHRHFGFAVSFKDPLTINIKPHKNH